MAEGGDPTTEDRSATSSHQNSVFRCDSNEGIPFLGMTDILGLEE